MSKATNTATLPRHADDFRLASRVASGDAAARRTFARRVFQRTRTIAYAILPTRADAEDAAQDCLLSLLSSVGTYRGLAPLERWADRVTVRACRNFAKTSRKRLERVDPSIGPDDISLLEFQSTHDERIPRPLLEYLAQLPQAQREALVMKHVLGFSYREIHELTGAKETTIRYRITAGLETIRSLIRRDCAIGAPKEPS